MTIHLLYFSCKYVQQDFMEKGLFNSLLSKKKGVRIRVLSKSMGNLGSIENSNVSEDLIRSDIDKNTVSGRDGKSTQIYHDAWLLNTEDGRISSPQGTLAPKSTVSTLISQESRWQNTYLIDIRFYPPKVKHIKSLPLCSTPQPDILIWPKEKSGNYSVLRLKNHNDCTKAQNNAKDWSPGK